MLVLFTGTAGSLAAPTSPTIDPQKARLSLSQIEPKVEAPAKAASAASQPNIPAAARNYFRSGQDRFEEQLWGEAINELARALQIAPEFDEARILLARAAILQGNSALAQTHLEEAARAHPDRVVVHELLGDIAFQAHDLAAASADFRRALLCRDAEPNRPETTLSHLFLGLALREQGYLSAAADQLTQFLAAVEGKEASAISHPELRQMAMLYRGKATVMVGDIHESLGNPADAVAAYRRGLAMNADDHDLKMRLAKALAKSGKTDEAIKLARELCRADDASPATIDALDEVCAASPTLKADDELAALAKEINSAAMLERIASRMVDRNRPADAAAVMERAVAAQPDRVDGHLSLASVRLRLGERRAFLNELGEAVRRSKDSSERVNGLIDRAAADAGERKKLIEVGREATGGDAKPDGVLLVLLGRLLWIDGQTDEAALVLGKASDVYPTLGMAYTTLAELKISKSMWQAALDSCDAAEKAEVREGIVYALKGQALEGLERTAEAKAAYEEAIRLSPKDAKSLLVLARLHEQLDETADAIKILRQIVSKVDPKNHEARESLIRTLLAAAGEGNQRDKFLKSAREQLSALKRNGAPANVAGRAEAFYQLAADGRGDPKGSLDTYRTALRKLIDQFPKDADTPLDLAMSYVSTRDYAEAMNVIDALLGQSPKTIRARELKATLLARLLRFDEAISVQESLLAERPKNAAWLSQLAELLADEGNYGRAAELYRTLAKRKESEARQTFYKSLMIDALRLSGDPDGAVAAAKEWVDASPRDDLPKRHYIQTLNEVGKKDEALNYVQHWLESQPDNQTARRILAYQLVELDRPDEAERRALAWMLERPADRDVATMVIESLLRAKHFDAAVELARTGADEPAGPEMAYLLANTLERARRYDEAASVLQDVIKSAQAPDGLQFELAQVYMAARRWNDAEEVIGKLMAPEQARMNANVAFDLGTVLRGYRLLATIYQNSGRLPKCHEALEKVLELTPVTSAEYTGACNDLGYLWADSGLNVDKAEKLVRIAVGEAPRRSAYLDSLGWVLYKKGDFSGASKYLKRANELLDTPDAVITEHYGDALYRAGDKAAAVEQWKKALKAISDDAEPLTPEQEDVLLRCRVKAGAALEGGPIDTAPTASEQAKKN